MLTRLRLRDFVIAPAVCHVSARRMRPGGLPPLHTHDFPELFWIEAGAGAVVTPQGRRPLVPGTLALVAPRDVHGFETGRADGYHIVNVAFARTTWAGLLSRYRLRDRDPLRRPPPARTFALSRGQLGELKAYGRDLVMGRRDRLALERFLLNVLELVTPLAPVGDGPVAPAWLRQALNALADGDGLERGTAALVESSGKSPEHVARECRRHFGKTPTALVNDRRVEHAARLLTAGEDNIVAVSLACGLSNLSHFYRLFRARFGVTPAEFRAAQRRIIDPREVV